MPKAAYNGQKLIKAVPAEIAAATKVMIPATPVTVLVKNNTNNTTANTKRMTLSVEPKFFFILFVF